MERDIQHIVLGILRKQHHHQDIEPNTKLDEINTTGDDRLETCRLVETVIGVSCEIGDLMSCSTPTDLAKRCSAKGTRSALNIVTSAVEHASGRSRDRIGHDMHLDDIDIDDISSALCAQVNLSGVGLTPTHVQAAATVGDLVRMVQRLWMRCAAAKLADIN